MNSRGDEMAALKPRSVWWACPLDRPRTVPLPESAGEDSAPEPAVSSPVRRGGTAEGDHAERGGGGRAARMPESYSK
jgi:hypothetical protein